MVSYPTSPALAWIESTIPRRCDMTRTCQGLMLWGLRVCIVRVKVRKRCMN